MPNLPWWGWLIVGLILVGMFPGMWHFILAHLHAGVQTVCNNCASNG